MGATVTASNRDRRTGASFTLRFPKIARRQAAEPVDAS